MNHYGYCFSNPIGIADNNGNWPKWITNAADAVGDTVNNATKAVADGAKKAVNAAGEFYHDHKEIINATLITAAAVTVTVATCGAGTALAVGAMSVGGGIVMGATSKDGFEKGFARGMADTSVMVASFAANPAGTILGFGGQAVTDLINGKLSSPETYAASSFGGAIANIENISLANAKGGAASAFMNDMLTNSVTDKHVENGKMLSDTLRGAIIGGAFDFGSWALNAIKPGAVKAEVESLTNPLGLISNFDTRSVKNIIDDFGRAAFGLNGGTNIIMNYADTYLTDKFQKCFGE